MASGCSSLPETNTLAYFAKETFEKSCNSNCFQLTKAFFFFFVNAQTEIS
jgi:hypothetical protein